MNTRRQNKRSGGFLDLATAVLIAAMTVAPLAIALALDIADSLPDADYPPSVYAR